MSFEHFKELATVMQPTKLNLPFARIALLLLGSLLLAPASGTRAQEIPEVLQPWQDWVTWGVEQRDSPTLYHSANERISFWPAKLELVANREEGRFATSVQVFDETWVPLPGSSEVWPMDVRAGDDKMVVVERDGHPAVKLTSGRHELTGVFRWKVMPQYLSVPKQIGIVSLEVDGNEVKSPIWDERDQLWLKRIRSQPADKDLLSLQIYRLIEDGIPCWLRTEIELTVSGKSREESLGWVLPAEWKISTVESPIPVAVDERGVMKAQVRAGKWTITVNAFRTSDPEQIAYAPEADVAVSTELVGLKTNSEFRISQLEDVPTIDVAQTTFPKKWRGHPVHLWETANPFRLVEKMRGMGSQRPSGLGIRRRMWLDEDGKGFTYRDQFHGETQQIWRLDVAEGHDLGTVRVDGTAQLITENPKSGATGVELRKRELDMEAIGRLNRITDMSATGWQTDADSLQLTFTLPPGWRALAIFGADQVDGDWLTSWSLLDLFLLLIFSFAVFRLYGIKAGIVAFLAFGLGYHEMGAPRLAWLFLLIPLALLRVVGNGPLKKWIQACQYMATGFLLLILIPFVAYQMQSVIYPQLEKPGFVYGNRDVFPWLGTRRVATVSAIENFAGRSDREKQSDQQLMRKSNAATANLRFDPRARIQTGPAQPQWEWNNVRCVWNGPVASDQTIRPILISLSQHRVLTIIRLGLVMLLLAIMLGAKRIRLPFSRRAATASLGVLLMLPSMTASAQIPDKEMLDALRSRILETPDVYPNAADIPTVALTIDGDTIEMRSQIHAAQDVAVPLPGRLPAWSPVSVTMDGGDDVVLTRRDDYLWVLVPQGIHDVVVTGVIPDTIDWEWTFVLKPRSVTVDAPGWKVTGLNSNNAPDDQLFFVKEQQSDDDRSAYDRAYFNPLVVVDRHLEIGLITKVRTTVTRLSSPGKAVSLQVPLLAGESVLSSKREVNDNTIAVRLTAGQKQTQWESELPVGDEIKLGAIETDEWVERWHLVSSPIWNIQLEGLQPIYQAEQKDLVPVWYPWPGEEVTLRPSKPTAMTGETMTVRNVNYETKLGSRIRHSELKLEIECSIASDFEIGIDPQAEVTALSIDGQAIPVQRRESTLILPAQPGKHNVVVSLRHPALLGTRARTSEITLPIEASNITTAMVMPENRWTLWADGPLRGPAIRFWTILLVAVLAAMVLGSIPSSPLGKIEWVLLAIGLTQVHLVGAMLVVGWLFLLVWRGKQDDAEKNAVNHNLIQLAIVFMTAAAIGVLVIVVSQGLLGHPDMFISGNGSSRTYLQWFQPRVDAQLPTASVVSISVWYYRLAMLFWALWLAVSLLRWLGWGWRQFGVGGYWRKNPKQAVIQAELVADQDVGGGQR